MTTRADMSKGLSLRPSTPTKTFVLEVHSQDPVAYLRGLVGAGNVEETKDAFLFRVHLPIGTVWVDQLDERFWSFHTDMPAREAARFLKEHVDSRRDLDWIWLPSEHLRHVWPGARSRRVRTDFEGAHLLGDSAAAQDLRVQLSGSDAEALLDYISGDERYRSAVSFDSVQVLLNDPDLGWVTEALNRMGRFAVAGDSLEFHLQFVRAVVLRYRKLVTLFEDRAITWQFFEDRDQGGGYVVGQPITIQFSRTVEDLSRFLNELCAARLPFRLWGVPQVTDGVAEVEAVDLHVGQRLRLDVGDSWMRVYLEAGNCGNTVARLISNLQHRFDGALSLADPELDAAVNSWPASLPPSN
jgi:hypothetical protein